MPVKKTSSKTKSKSKRRSSSDMVVPGYTRSSGAYGRYQPMGPELKWKDSSSGTVIVPFGLAAANQLINLVDLGTGPNQRIGRSITIRHIEVKINMQANWTLPAGAPPTVGNVSYRVDLILDKQANGAVPAGGDIYDTLIGAVAPENRFPNLLNSDRFVIMKRWEGDLNPPSIPLTDPVNQQLTSIGRDLKLSKKCNIRVELNPSTPTTIADVRSNNLLLVFSGSQGQPGAAGVQFLSTCDTRIRFQDS